MRGLEAYVPIELVLFMETDRVCVCVPQQQPACKQMQNNKFVVRIIAVADANDVFIFSFSSFDLKSHFSDLMMKTNSMPAIEREALEPFV